MTLNILSGNISYWVSADQEKIPQINVDTTVEEFDVRYQKCQKINKQDNCDTIEIIDINSYTMWHRAIKCGNIGVMKRIVDLVGNKVLSLQNDDGWTGMHCAVKHQQYEAVQLLLE